LGLCGEQCIYLNEDFERLDRLLRDLERGIEPITQGEMRRVVEDEAVIGEEPPARAQ
jgi:hypothetical protein